VIGVFVAGKKGQTWSKPMTKQQRDEIALTKIEKMLDDQRDGVVELTPIQLKALEIRYHKLRPSLSAVEQTNLNPQDQITESQLISNLHSFLQANPDVLPQLIAMQQKPVESQSNPTPTVTH
jgi:hypothetical protein